MAITTTQLAIQLMIVAVQNADSLGRLISNAQAQGRDVTPEELNALVGSDAVARKALQEAIDRASGIQTPT